jgi:acyl dehydratase
LLVVSKIVLAEGGIMNVREQAAWTVEDLKSRVGEQIGLSAWHSVTQEMIDEFAEVTGDHQFIHTDPARAKAETSFGGTIAHGFLTLSLLSLFGREAVPLIAGRKHGINYGFDRLRFMAPVKSGARLRGRFTLKEVSSRPGNMLQVRYGVTVEIEGSTKPALVADWLTLAVME